MTVQELIIELQKIKDKSQTIYVWDRYGYYGEVTTVDIETRQAKKPLMILSD